MSAQDSHEIGIIKIMLTKGTDGRGIEKIEKTSTSGIYDTYTITYDDGSKTTYTITNGNGIASIEKTGTSGLVDTYTITFDNGMVETFDVTNGDYISNIAKTGTSGAVDTYTITMASGTTYTFTVVNGDGSLATDIIFDDTTAQLSASTVQGAIDKLAKPTFTEASTRANIASGEKLSVILGKIKKFFTDLKTVAFTGAYSDLSGRPSLATVATSGSYNDLTNKPPQILACGSATINYGTTGSFTTITGPLGTSDHYGFICKKTAPSGVNCELNIYPFAPVSTTWYLNAKGLTSGQSVEVYYMIVG